MSADRTPALQGTPIQGPITPKRATDTDGAAKGQSFAATFSLQVATLKAQSLSVLVGAVSGEASSFTPPNSPLSTTAASPSSLFDVLASTRTPNNTQAVTPATTIPGLTPTGRIGTLRDPESAYRMMSVINAAEVHYKAQHAELNGMRDTLSSLQKAAQTLGEKATGNETGTHVMETALVNLRDNYNAWIARFGDLTKPGSLLAGTQAAEISLSELRNTIGNIFNGAAHGIHGLADLGFSLDPTSQQAVFDPQRFATVLGENPKGVQAALSEFSGNFTHAAALLASPGNFIDNRLHNLQRAIGFIADNKPALQAEFGLGDPAKPSAMTSAALASYSTTATT